MTCAICGEPAEGGPLCAACLDERREHRISKAQHRATVARARHERETTR